VSAPEFSRPVALDALGGAPRRFEIEANEAERAALAERFGLLALDALTADVALVREGQEVRAEGHVHARATQSCVATGAPVPAEVDAPLGLVFRPLVEARPDEEIELGEEELDVVFYEGGAIDLGEAAAQTLYLALDPYPRSPDAEAALRAAGVKSEEEAGPFGALAGLKDRLSGPDRAS